MFLEKIQTIGFYQNSDVLFYPAGYKLLGIYLSFGIVSVNDLPEQLPWFCLEVYLGG